MPGVQAPSIILRTTRGELLTWFFKQVESSYFSNFFLFSGLLNTLFQPAFVIIAARQGVNFLDIKV